MVEGVASATAVTGSSMIKSDANSGSLGYLIDSMFRRNVSPSAGSAKGEAVLNQAPEASVITRIFITTLRAASLPAEDVRYIGGVVSYRTGLTQQEAEKRVNDTFARVQTMLRETETAAREAADAARKASAYAALWLFVSLLIGAFVASFAATIGGRQRDL